MVAPGKNWYRNYFYTTVFRKESSTTYQKSKSPSRCEIPFFSRFLRLFFRYFQNPRMRNREKKSSLLMVSLLRNDCFCALLLDRNITFNHLILFYVLFLFLYEVKKKKKKKKSSDTRSRGIFRRGARIFRFRMRVFVVTFTDSSLIPSSLF